MIKIKNIMLGIFALIFLTNFISAISITIDIKPSFSIGEEISFDYTIFSATTQKIEYLVSVNCPNAPLTLLEIKNADLTANVPLAETHVYMSNLNDNIEPQNCRAVISILTPEELSEEKNFDIQTNPSFEFNVLICKDLYCKEQTKVFVKDEDIYFDYSSDIGGISATAVLTSPEGNIQQLTLPSSIKTEQIGTYELEINATKQGYKTISEEIQFGVIEKKTNIGYTSLSENKLKPEFNENLILYLIMGVVMIIAVILFCIIYKRKKESE